MPEAVSFVVNTYVKLARDETGITNAATRRVPAAQALDWILSEFPDDAVTVDVYGTTTKVTIEWSQVPEYLRNPKLPARRR